MLVEQSKSSLTKSRKENRDSYVEQFQLTQHQFQTQREQATHTSLHNNQTTTLRQSSSSELLGNLSIEFHINNPIREILYEFKIILNRKGYKCIEIFENQMYIVRMRLIDKLKKLFGCLEPPKYLLQIRTHEFRSVRTVTIKPLQVTGVIQSENDGDTARSRDTPGSYHQASELLDYLSQSSKLNKPLTNEQLNQLDSQYKQDIYSLDATANFMFSRMLVDTNYTIGKRISQVVNQFRDNKRCIQDLKYVQLLWMNKAIAEVTQQMLQGFNCSRKELYQILGYCRKSIEGYFYRCMEQNQIEMATQKQRKRIQENIPQKDNNRNYLTSSVQSNARRQLQLQQLYPVSMKHLNILNSVVISIEIFQQLFSLSEFIKIETQSKQLGEERKGEFLQWIKEKYGERIMQKLKVLRAAGFGDKCFERLIKEMKLQE